MGYLFHVSFLKEKKKIQEGQMINLLNKNYEMKIMGLVEKFYSSPYSCKNKLLARTK